MRRFASVLLALSLLTGCAQQPPALPPIPPEPPTDVQISQAVRSAFAADRDLNGWAIRVETYQGNVQLSGTVRSEKEKLRAQDIAAGVSGVNQVFNTITIKY